ncbi:MAG: TetR/AcrR family transcriptional regulator [Desulfovibrionaceae bacterium]|nr:TetR/AcrR family transcriptional regulator [Desulfovibrionaceae bacterium]
MTEKQLDIIMAAVPAFERLGFSGVSMEQIATAARVSKRTLYRHYPGKEAVFAAIIAYLRRERRTQPYPVYDQDRPVAPQLEALTRAMCVNLNDEDRVRLTRIILSELLRVPALGGPAHGDPAHGCLVDGDPDREDLEPFRWIDAAMRAGALRRGDPGLALRQLAALVKAEVLWPRLTMGRPALDEAEIDAAARECAAVLLARYLPPA